MHAERVQGRSEAGRGMDKMGLAGFARFNNISTYQVPYARELMVVVMVVAVKMERRLFTNREIAW